MTRDSIYDALSKTPRRRLLRVLQQKQTLTVDEAAEEVKGASKVELWHAHLPKLAETGVIEWDPDNPTIERGDEFDAVHPIIESHPTA